MRDNSDETLKAAKAPNKSKEPENPTSIRRPVGSRRSFVREFLDFLIRNKKWWLLPIILVLILVSLLLVVAASAPFIYTIF